MFGNINGVLDTEEIERVSNEILAINPHLVVNESVVTNKMVKAFSSISAKVRIITECCEIAKTLQDECGDNIPGILEKLAIDSSIGKWEQDLIITIVHSSIAIA